MADAALQRREYVRFAFYKVGEAWRGLDQEARLAAAAEVENVVNRFAEGMMIRPYSTVGMRADTDICFWSASHELASIQDFATAFAGAALRPVRDQRPPSGARAHLPTLRLDASRQVRWRRVPSASSPRWHRA